ncbi:amino acid transporter, partial [Planococcus sp. SIMBA_143]
SLSYEGLEKMAFTTACIVISWMWFIGLAVVGRTVGNFDTKGVFLNALNKISAVIIWGVALYLAIQLYNGI